MDSLCHEIPYRKSRAGKHRELGGFDRGSTGVAERRLSRTATQPAVHYSTALSNLPILFSWYCIV